MRTNRSLSTKPVLKGIAVGVAFAIGLALSGCGGTAETESERAGNRVKDDVRSARDLLRDRGVTIDTRTAP